MSIHDDIQEMIPGYTLGAMEQQEAAQAEAHLASCDRCTRVLEEYRPVARALALSVPMIQPPADLKVRTMQLVTEEKARKKAESASLLRLLRRRSWLTPSFAAAAIVAAIVTFGFTAWQTAQLSRQVQAQKELMTVVAYAQGAVQIVRGTTKAPNAVGRLYMDPDSSVAALVTVNMPPLAGNRVYQVWLTDSQGSKVSGGLFQLDSEGNGWLLVRARSNLASYIQVGVTDEPTGGSNAPTTPPVLLAKFASP
jgi:anti-sigma-K factor RskA